MNRVVVTGLGVVSPIGNTTAAYWANVKQGTNGAGPITLVPTPERLIQKVAAEVKDFDPLRYFEERQISTLDRVTQFAVVAAREAIAQTELTFDKPLSERTATIIGTGAGGQTTQDDNFRRIYRENKTRVFPLTIPKAMANAPASQISMECGLRGPTFAVASACASGAHAVGLAFQMLRSGMVDCAVTGGAEACITFGTVRGWEAMRVMAPDACRPFSIGRQGLVLGEGAAILVLESLERARARGADILGEVVGFGMSANATDLTSPDLDGMARAVRGALADAQLDPRDIQYVNAHGTGTAANDVAENQVLHQVFGAHARNLVVSSTKSMIGHALGAAGALEIAATLLAVREDLAPPTIGYLGPDPACDLDYVPNEARAMAIDAALSNSFAFGGLNSVLVVRKFS
ncbi:MAG: beta-ketoacyl-[acyl-carrier-protein] synthase family protein [Arenicellales bacterium]